MGRLILCCGEQAEHPWYVKESDTKLYSMEELCYYIYNNIYIISRSFFNLGLVDWIGEELKLPVAARKLRELVINYNSPKDMVVTVLCSTDYYTEWEIKELIQIMDELSHKSEAQREKYKADLWLRKGRFSLAAKEYKKLLGGRKGGLTAEEMGDIFHNLGIACLHIGTMEEAAGHFWEAYERNHRRESLKAYVGACQIAGIEAAQLSAEDEEETEGLLADVERSAKEYRQTQEYKRFQRAVEKRLAGQSKAYEEEIGKLLKEWKQEYRKKVG